MLHSGKITAHYEPGNYALGKHDKFIEDRSLILAFNFNIN
jgi:hypothetical protein